MERTLSLILHRSSTSGPTPCEARDPRLTARLTAVGSIEIECEAEADDEAEDEAEGCLEKRWANADTRSAA